MPHSQKSAWHPQHTHAYQNVFTPYCFDVIRQRMLMSSSACALFWPAESCYLDDWHSGHDGVEWQFLQCKYTDKGRLGKKTRCLFIIYIPSRLLTEKCFRRRRISRPQMTMLPCDWPAPTAGQLGENLWFPDKLDSGRYTILVPGIPAIQL